MSEWRKVRKKPVEVDVWGPWDGTAQHIPGVPGVAARVEHLDMGSVVYLEVRTLEGALRASMGDYIIRGVKGELYPCKPDIFEQTYEEAQ